MQHRLVRPWLPHTHRNFFVIYAGTIAFHLWSGLNALLGPATWFQLPAYRYINQVAAPHTWGYASLTVALLLWLNLHLADFRWARYALGLGGALVWMRFALIWLAANHGADIGNSLPNLFLCGMVHAAQALEPPVNPATAKAT